MLKYIVLFIIIPVVVSRPLKYLHLSRTAKVPVINIMMALMVFVALVQSSASFRDEAHLQRWLVRCTIHRCRNLTLSAWRRHTVPFPTGWDVPA